MRRNVQFTVRLSFVSGGARPCKYVATMMELRSARRNNSGNCKIGFEKTHTSFWQFVMQRSGNAGSIVPHVKAGAGIGCAAHSPTR